MMLQWQSLTANQLVTQLQGTHIQREEQVHIASRSSVECTERTSSQLANASWCNKDSYFNPWYAELRRLHISALNRRHFRSSPCCLSGW